MIGILIGAVGMIAIILGWLAIASFVYCRLSGHMELFVWPFDQWLEIAPYWTVTGWTKIDVIASAVIAMLPLVAIGYCIVLQQRRKRRRPSLYGATGWANPEEIERGGIKLRKDVV